MKEEEKTEIKKIESNLPSYDLSQPLPSLADAEALPIDLMSDYWTPETVGEKKRLFFDKVAPSRCKDNQTGAEIELDCAFFLEQTKIDGKQDVKSVRNGSKRLVGMIEGEGIQRGTPLEVTYLGKKKNSTNGFMSDQWRVRPLIIKI